MDSMPTCRRESVWALAWNAEAAGAVQPSLAALAASGLADVQKQIGQRRERLQQLAEPRDEAMNSHGLKLRAGPCKERVPFPGVANEQGGGAALKSCQPAVKPLRRSAHEWAEVYPTTSKRLPCRRSGARS